MKSRAQFLSIAIIAGLAGGAAFASNPTAFSSDTLPERYAPAEEGPSVSIAKQVIDAAGAFERYFRTANAVNPEFDGPASVSAALMTGAAYNSRQLEQGAVAYAALVALQEPTFVGALSDISANASDRAAFVERLTAAPDQVLELAGAPQAAALASLALNDLGSGLVSRGHAVAQAAYTVQRQPWALEPVAQPAERLAQVQAAGNLRARLTERETSQLMTKLVARRDGAEGLAAVSRPSPTVLRGLVLAAAAVLGQAGETRADSLSPLMTDAENAACLRRAKLNLQQCLAAVGPEYEELFCAGQHAMADTGECIVKAAGGGVADGVRVPIARAAYSRKTAASVAVPIARSPARPASRADEAPSSEQPTRTEGSGWAERRAATAPPADEGYVPAPKADDGEGGARDPNM